MCPPHRVPGCAPNEIDYEMTNIETYSRTATSAAVYIDVFLVSSLLILKKFHKLC